MLIISIKLNLLSLLLISFILKSNGAPTNQTSEFAKKLGGYYGQSYASKLSFDIVHGEGGLTENNWHLIDPDCKQDNAPYQESPIAIKTADAVATDVPTVAFENFDKKCTGWKVYYESDTLKYTSEEAKKAITISSQGTKYSFQSIAFRSDDGKEYQKGSEHTIDGKTYPIELQIEFVTSDALSYFTYSILLNIDYYNNQNYMGYGSNPYNSYYYSSKQYKKLNLHYLLNSLRTLNLAAVQESGTAGISIGEGSFSLEQILNSKPDQLLKGPVFFYLGSRTQPPCKSSGWLLFTKHFTISLYEVGLIQSKSYKTYRTIQATLPATKVFKANY